MLLGCVRVDLYLLLVLDGHASVVFWHDDVSTRGDCEAVTTSSAAAMVVSSGPHCRFTYCTALRTLCARQHSVCASAWAVRGRARRALADTLNDRVGVSPSVAGCRTRQLLRVVLWFETFVTMSCVCRCALAWRGGYYVLCVPIVRFWRCLSSARADCGTLRDGPLGDWVYL